MKKNIIIVILLCIIAFGGCYIYTNKYMSEDEINNIMRYIPFKEKKSIKTDGSKKHNTNKKNSNKNVPESVKKKSKAKETVTVEAYKCKYCNDTIYYIIEDKEYGINGDICWNCYWNKLMDIIFGSIEDNEEEEESVEEPVNNDDYDTNICSICGSHVGVKEMCECDGTIHHRTCHINNDYTCPNCNRNGLTEDPDVYGCPYCGYPNIEEEEEEPEIKEPEIKEPEEPEHIDEELTKEYIDGEEPVKENESEEYDEPNNDDTIIEE